MNKLQLIDELKKQPGVSKQEARQVVGLFFDSMVIALVRGDRMEIRGCSRVT